MEVDTCPVAHNESRVRVETVTQDYEYLVIDGLRLKRPHGQTRPVIFQQETLETSAHSLPDAPSQRDIHPANRPFNTSRALQSVLSKQLKRTGEDQEDLLRCCAAVFQSILEQQHERNLAGNVCQSSNQLQDTMQELYKLLGVSLKDGSVRVSSQQSQQNMQQASSAPLQEFKATLQQSVTNLGVEVNDLKSLMGMIATTTNQFLPVASGGETGHAKNECQEETHRENVCNPATLKTREIRSSVMKLEALSGIFDSIEVLKARSQDTIGMLEKLYTKQRLYAKVPQGHSVEAALKDLTQNPYASP